MTYFSIERESIFCPTKGYWFKCLKYMIIIIIIIDFI